MLGAIVITEFLVVLKGDIETVTKPLPQHIEILWIIIISGFVLLTVWKVYIYCDVKCDIPEELHIKCMKDVTVVDSLNKSDNCEQSFKSKTIMDTHQRLILKQ